MPGVRRPRNAVTEAKATGRETPATRLSRHARSVVVSVNSQNSLDNRPDRFTELRHIYTLAVCAALAR
jgi:hypothetical protein